MGTKTSGKYAIYPAAGTKFGFWEVITGAPSRRSPTGKMKAYVLCRCVCGTTKPVQLGNLRAGHSPSCGCQTRTRVGQMNLRHGLTKTPIHNVWLSMKQRCENPNNHSFFRYGARGIRVCERWQTFENFLSDMGKPARGATIERINNDGDYEPSNCRWATRLEQANNRRPRAKATLLSYA